VGAQPWACEACGATRSHGDGDAAGADEVQEGTRGIGMELECARAGPQLALWYSALRLQAVVTEGLALAPGEEFEMAGWRELVAETEERFVASPDEVHWMKAPRAEDLLDRCLGVREMGNE
jgi:hypothetical protein